MIGAAQTLAGEGFLGSALTADGRVTLQEFHDWFARQRSAHSLIVRRVPFSDLGLWALEGDPLRLRHESRKFFTVDGIRVQTDFGPLRQWDQPIINQPEIGILGIVTRVFDGVRHFLMQAKVEPGNVGGVQLSPTVQATRSNYTRVHGGKMPIYHEYFLQRGRARILVDQLQGEQASRFLRKRNRNMIVEVQEEIPLADNFCWLTLGQIKRLLKHDNLVNMDARSVLACLPLVHEDPAARETLEADARPTGFALDLMNSALVLHGAHEEMRELLHWITDLRSRYEIHVTPHPVDALDGWEVTDDSIHHVSGRYFSVIGVEVEARDREVVRWRQPLLDHQGYGLNGFVLQKINGVLHFLVRACMYPGSHELFELGSTVSRSNADEHFGRADAPQFLELFREPPASWIRYAAVQSEEGGRFFHYQNRYVLIEVPEETRLSVPETHRWMTLGQIQQFVRHGYVNVEGRNLLACLDLSPEELAQ